MAEVPLGTLVQYGENGGLCVAMVVANPDDWSEGVYAFNGETQQPAPGQVLLAVFDSNGTYASAAQYPGTGPTDSYYQFLP
jgi:hypothetical protein